MRREIEISENSESSRPSELSITTSTSAALRPLTPWPPAKITSCIVCPRTASGLCSPSAHSTASVMFDLPLPFGPTITLMPGPKSSRVRSGKDLKPFSVIDFRCMARHRRPRGRRASLERRRAPPPARTPSWCGRCRCPSVRAADLGDRLEQAVVRRPLLVHDPVDHDLAPLREPLLQLALEVVHAADRALDLRLEGLRDRLRGRARTRTRESRRRSPPRPPRPARSRPRRAARPGARSPAARPRACAPGRRSRARPPRTSAG